MLCKDAGRSEDGFNGAELSGVTPLQVPSPALRSKGPGEADSIRIRGIYFRLMYISTIVHVYLFKSILLLINGKIM